MPAPGSPKFCLGKPYCGLCRFPFLDNESVLICLGKDEAETGYVTATFPFQKEKTFYEPLEIHICCTRSCIFAPKTIIGQHPDCFHLYVRCGYPIHHTSELISYLETCPYVATPSFQSATGLSFWPAEGESQRVRYIRDALAPRLASGWVWPRSLPLEVWRVVAGYLVQECAVIMAREQVPEHAPPLLSHTMSLSLKTPIYGTYVSIEGQYYLRRLQTTSHVTPKSCLLFPGCSKAKMREIQVLAQVDHIGVRRLLFVRQGSRRWDELTRRQQPVRGLNWTYLRAAEITYVEASLDVLKVRDINTEDSLKFPVPLLTSPEVRQTVSDWQTGPYGYGPLRFIDFNHPGTTGYSVAYTGRCPVSILAHRQDETVGADQYDDIGYWLPCAWLYMPMDPGEYVTDISRQIRRKPFPTRCIDFILSTNHGRTHRFGGNGEMICKYILRLAELAGMPYRMFYIHANNGTDWPEISDFYCEADDNTSNYASFLDGVLAKMPRNVERPLAFPDTWEERRWIHSACSLQAVLSIQICTRKTDKHRPVIGMLFTYKNGHRECVGQWRFDWVSEPIKVDDAESLHFCYKYQEVEDAEEEGFYDEEEDREYFGEEEEQSYHISAVSLKQQHHMPSHGYEGCCMIPMTGTLDWWCTLKQEAIFHNGESILDL